MKVPMTTMVECSRQQHTLKTGRNSSAAYVTCLTCRHHVAWLRHSAGPDPGTAFDTVTNLMLQRAWTAIQAA